MNIKTSSSKSSYISLSFSHTLSGLGQPQYSILKTSKMMNQCLYSVSGKNLAIFRGKIILHMYGRGPCLALINTQKAKNYQTINLSANVFLTTGAMNPAHQISKLLRKIQRIPAKTSKISSNE